MGYRKSLKTWTPFLALLLTTFSIAESVHTGRPQGASRQRADGMNSPKVPGMGAFFSTVGVVPPVSISHITPLTEDSPEAIRKWTREVRLWKINSERLAFLLGRLARANKETTTAPDFARGMAELQKKISSAARKVSQEEKSAGDLSKLKVNSLGGLIVSDLARKLNEEVVLLTIGFAESLVEVTEENPKMPEARRKRLALSRLKARIPKEQLTRLDVQSLENLSPHHRSQIEELQQLRDTLYAQGNFIPFIEQYYQGVQSRKVILDG